MKTTTNTLLAWVVMVTIPLGCQTSKWGIYLENGGLCDTKPDNYEGYHHEKCRKIVVHGNFSYLSNLQCVFERVKYVCTDPEEGCTTHKLIAIDYTDWGDAHIINSSTVVCQRYDGKPYFVSVGHRAYRYRTGSVALFLPYNSLCQKCNAETATCVSTPSQMKSFCRRKNGCFILGNLAPESQCKECRKAENGSLYFMDIRSNYCGYMEFPAWSIALLVIVGIAAVVVIGFLVYTCFFKTKDPSTYNRVEDAQATTPAANSPGQNEQA